MNIWAYFEYDEFQGWGDDYLMDLYKLLEMPGISTKREDDIEHEIKYYRDFLTRCFGIPKDHDDAQELTMRVRMYNNIDRNKF